MRGAELVVKSLAGAGVDTIFALSGNQIMPIFDACIDADIRIIHTRHEGAAVFMADAYAQVTGKLGVALVTAAPGFTNCLGAMFSALHSESPVLLLSGDSPVSQDGKGAFQELDQVAMSAPVTKHSRRILSAEELGMQIAEAVREARGGRPGPMHCALPFDLVNADVANVEAPKGGDFEPDAQLPETGFVEQTVQALNEAEKPLILTGPAMNRQRAGDVLKRLEAACDAPVIPIESPRGLNDPALGDFASVLKGADLIVSIGKRLDYTLRFAGTPVVHESCKVIVCDPDQEALAASKANAGSRFLIGFRADARATAEALCKVASGNEQRRQYRAEVAAALAKRAEKPPATSPIHPATLCSALEPLIAEASDPIVVIDGGEFGQWAQACLPAEARIINGASGAIGGCLCYAIGAKAARPDCDVFLLMGDGTSGFHFAEFETAHRYGLPFTAVIGNDARWNAEHQIQLRDYGENRTYACELDPTRYDEAVAAFGGHGEQVSEPQDLEKAFRRARDSGLPACVNVMIEGVAAPAGASH